jgi:hypothetical protein
MSEYKTQSPGSNCGNHKNYGRGCCGLFPAVLNVAAGECSSADCNC